MTHLRSFSHALCQLHVISFVHCTLCVLFGFTRVIALVLVLQHQIENCAKPREKEKLDYVNYVFRRFPQEFLSCDILLT